MYCGCNKTALASQRQIARAMLSLMEQKPFDQISVCELCKSADVSRQTFYSLFSSRENIIAFILQEKYFYTPEGTILEDESPQEICGIRALCRGYSRYILQNRDFLQILVQNHIDYLLYDCIFEALISCECFLKEVSPCTRRYAAGFYAGGISSVARCFATEGCTSSASELEDMLFTFFTGSLF